MHLRGWKRISGGSGLDGQESVAEWWEERGPENGLSINTVMGVCVCVCTRRGLGTAES